MDNSRVLDALADEFSAAPLISLIYGEADIRHYAAQVGVDKDLALRRAHEWARHIQDTAAGLCEEPLLSVISGAEP